MLRDNNECSELIKLRNKKYCIANMEGLGMKWYKFNIYFRLFFSITVLLFDIATFPISYRDLLYVSWNVVAYFCFAIIFDMVLIAGTILARHWLARFNKKGVLLYFITQYLSEVIIFIAILLLLGFNEETFAQTFGKLISYGIIFLFDYRYWKKRVHLFSDFNQNVHMHSSENNTQIKSPNYNSFTVCIYDTITNNTRNEERTIDTNKFPTEKYAVDGKYYAIETIKNGKKVRIYCSKLSWQSQVDNQKSDNNKIKFCRKCGFKLIDDSEFCSQCGAKIF